MAYAIYLFSVVVTFGYISNAYGLWGKGGDSRMAFAIAGMPFFLVFTVVGSIVAFRLKPIWCRVFYLMIGIAPILIVMIKERMHLWHLVGFALKDF